MSRELNLRLFSTISYLSQDLVAVRPQGLAHIWNLLFNDFHQQWRDLLKEGITHVVVPCRNEDAVFWLQDEVV